MSRKIRPMSEIRAWAARTGREILSQAGRGFDLVTGRNHTGFLSRPRFRRRASAIMRYEEGSKQYG